MSVNRPTAWELLAAVREFLASEVTPQLRAATQFHLRVAANVLAIVERELAQRGGADAAELASLSALLEREGTLAQLNVHLVEAIRAGCFDAEPGRCALLAHLRQTTAVKLAIDNPRYGEER